MSKGDPVNVTKSHISAIWVFLVSTIPVVLGTIEYIYLPRFASAVEHTIQKEIRDPDQGTTDGLTRRNANLTFQFVHLIEG